MANRINNPSLGLLQRYNRHGLHSWMEPGRSLWKESRAVSSNSSLQEGGSHFRREQLSFRFAAFGVGAAHLRKAARGCLNVQAWGSGERSGAQTPGEGCPRSKLNETRDRGHCGPLESDNKPTTESEERQPKKRAKIRCLSSGAGQAIIQVLQRSQDKARGVTIVSGR